MAKSKYLIAMILLVFLLAGCGQRSESREMVQYETNLFVMDTVVLLRINAPISQEEATEIFAAAHGEMQRLEAILSAHLPGSDVEKISKSAGVEPVPVHPETMAVLETALAHAQLARGAFDVTLAPVLGLYDFSGHRRPSAEELAQALLLVDWQQVVVDSEAGTVFLPEQGMALDLGGIAKGYIVDRVSEFIEAKGIEHVVVNAGGDIYMSDVKPDGSKWRIGITNPVLGTPHNFAVVEMGRGALVTSGDYERFFIEDGVRYHHILDPATGLPARHNRSVTVVAPNAELADLWSTALFVLTPQEALALAESLQDIEALIWDSDDRITYTSGMESILTLSD